MKTHNFNSEEIENFKYGCNNLEDFLARIDKKQQENGYVVCQFVINGIKISEADEQRMKSFSLKDIHSLTLFFEEPNQLLIEIVQNWKDEIPKIIENADQLAGTIRTSGVENQIGSFIQLVESCQLLVQSLLSLSHVIDTHGLFDTGQWIIGEQMLAEAVGQTLKSFDARDTKALADIIEYDLANTLMTWIEIFNLLDKLITANPEAFYIRRDPI